jgi:hypothetical protein
LPSDQATSIANSINSGTLTEAQFIDSLLSQAADTTIPAVAVENSMYGAVGTSAEITSLVTNFLPNQIAYAVSMGLNPTVYASEVLGLAFAFGNEAGDSAFAAAFGPSNVNMPNTPTGDIAFATAASTAIFGYSTVNSVNAIDGWVANWKAFYTSHGLPGISNANELQVDLAARGAAWGDAVGVALANNLSQLIEQATNFLVDAAQGNAIYSGSLASQPAHAAAEGATSPMAAAEFSSSAAQLIGVAAHFDHAMI